MVLWGNEAKPRTTLELEKKHEDRRNERAVKSRLDETGSVYVAQKTKFEERG